MFLLGPLLLAVVSVIWAEEEYFPLKINNTWDAARNHCRVCYKDLTTITPGNAHFIIQKVIALNLNSSYWIGLRQNFSGSIPWSQWSNGAPVIYQNWYPGRPILKKPEVIVPTSPAPTTSTNGSRSNASTTNHYTTASTNSTSGTTYNSSKPTNEQVCCPTLEKLIACLNGSDYLVTTIENFNFTDYTTTVHSTSPSTLSSTSLSTLSSTSLSTISTYNTTNTAFITSPSTSLMKSSSYSTPIPKTDYDYIEDSCVALFSFGMWREKHCYESLPFICYDEQFTGKVIVSDVTHNGSVVTWSKAPGDNVDYYIVRLSWSDNDTVVNITDLTTELKDLEAGKHYRVEVFPVKCNRTLNSLSTDFYTLPMTISDLTILDQTTNSITIRWSKPEGGCENYYVNCSAFKNSIVQTNVTCNITNLEPGQSYNFTVSCVVNSNLLGHESPVKSAYTRPSKVQNLTSSNNDTSNIYASWNSNDKNSLSYRYNVILMNESNIIKNITLNVTTIKLEGLTEGTKYTLNVSALVNDDTVRGEEFSINAFTMPETVQNLVLKSTENNITANWNLLKGSKNCFLVRLILNGIEVKNTTITELSHTFSELKSTTQYTVGVVTKIGNLSSKEQNETTYTSPKKPINVQTANVSSTYILLKWNPPKDSDSSQNITYNVLYYSYFWGKSDTWNVTGSNSTDINNLTPGTKYKFSVRVYAGSQRSEEVFTNATTVSNQTYLTLTMLCTSNTSLHCNDVKTKEDFQIKLNQTLQEKFGDDIFWKLNSKEGKL